MPPAPALKSSRPSVYANPGSSCSAKKRASVSPAEAAGGHHNHHYAKGQGRKEISPPKQRFQAQGQSQYTQASAFASTSSISASGSAFMKPTGVVVTAGASKGSAVQNRLLFEDEYSAEVEEYMYLMEDQTTPSADFIDMQPELQWYMRPYLVDFLIEIHQQFRLRPEVLYLALNIVDRYVSKRVVYKKHYQLVGCAALWIASKFEDAKDRVPTVKELADMCCKAYDETAFIQMEGHLLQTIGWTIGHPTAEAWMRLMCQGTQESTQVQHVARFIMECTLFTRDFVGIKPSSIARGSLLMARYICGQVPTGELSRNEKDVKHVVTCLDVLFSQHAKSVSAICIEKYAPAYYSKASTITTQFYEAGHRYRHTELPITPASALSNSLISPWSRRDSAWSGGSPSGFYSNASSECGDEMLPKTPCTPVGAISSVDPFVVQAMSAGHASTHGVTPVMMATTTMKENVLPAGYDVLGPKRNVSQSNYAVTQQQRVALQSVQPQSVSQQSRVRRLSN